jgi:hypothetical protein
MGLLNRGNSSAATLRKPLPTNNVSTASSVVSQTDVLTANSGGAGTKGTLMLAYGPIASAYGDLVGKFGDSSLVITSTALTTEVPFEQVMARAGANQNNVDGGAVDYSAYLANGEYYVVYETGRIYYSKADNSTSVSASYKYRQLTTSGSGSGGGGGGGSSSAGGASSGDATYMSPADFTATYASATTLTITGLPFTPTTAQFMSVKKQGTSGTAVTYTPDTYAFSYDTSTGILTVTGASFSNTDSFLVTVVGPTKMMDAMVDAQKNALIRDVSDQYANETLIDTTNVAAGTNYYPSTSGLQMDGYSTITIQGKTSGGVTTTIEATNDDAASPDWVDITKSFTDLITATGGNATYVDANFLLAPTGRDILSVKAIRIKSVTSTSTNVVKCNIRRMY